MQTASWTDDAPEPPRVPGRTYGHRISVQHVAAIFADEPEPSTDWVWGGRGQAPPPTPGQAKITTPGAEPRSRPKPSLQNPPNSAEHPAASRGGSKFIISPWSWFGLLCAVLFVIVLATAPGETTGPINVAKFLSANPAVVAHSYDIWHDGVCDAPGQIETSSTIDSITKTSQRDIFGAQDVYLVHCTNGFSSNVDGTYP